MALLLTEGFGSFADDDDMRLNPYIGCHTSYTTITSGRFGGNGLRISNYAGWFEKSFAAASTVIIGFAFLIDNAATPSYHATRNLADIMYGSTIQAKLHVDSSRNIQVRTWDNVWMGSSSGISIGAFQWNYIELKLVISDTVGKATVHANGVEVIDSAASFDTKNGYSTANKIYLNWANPCDTHYDDLYVCDTTGSKNNDFLGDCRIDTIRPIGAGTHTDFTPLSGSNYENVDEAYPDGDTSYNQSNTTGHQDSYEMGNLSSLGTTIHGVKPQIVVKKTDATLRKCKILTVSGGSDYLGDEIVLPSSYALYEHIYEDNPDDAAAWAEADVNSMETGAEVTA